MPLTNVPLEYLTNADLIIDVQLVSSSGGGENQHVYAATGRHTGAVPLAGNAEVADAVESARRALSEWRRLSSSERRDQLDRLANAILTNSETLKTLQIIESALPHRFASTL